MKDIDFSYCPFIKKELSFITYHDFCENAKITRLHYRNMELNGKIFYKFYVYANIHTDEKRKDLIWEYLNSEDNEEKECYERLINKNKHRIY